jgi:hypothetical protein
MIGDLRLGAQHGAAPLGVLPLLLLTLSGCGRAGGGETGPPEAVLRGREVYLEQFCGTCHALASAGTAGRFGPSHDGVGAVAEDRIADPTYEGSAQTAREYLMESIVKPGAYRVPGFAGTRFVMPSYQHLPKEDLDALVEMLSHERGPG